MEMCDPSAAGLAAEEQTLKQTPVEAPSRMLNLKQSTPLTVSSQIPKLQPKKK